MRFRRRAIPETFAPGRKDKRVNEARNFLYAARHLRNLTPHGLACQFNLKPATAELLLSEEQKRRA